MGIEPTDVGKLARKSGIDTIISPFNYKLAKKICQKKKVKVITAANVFAHIENIHDVMKGISTLLDKKGIFISESHYLINLLKTLQYDTVYHEHLRYYSIKSLNHLFKIYNFKIFHAKKIPTHGGSIRIYASRVKYKPTNSYKRLLKEEKKYDNLDKILSSFGAKIKISKIKILNLLADIKLKNKKIVGIGAPSRASTLINYLGLDNSILDYICEVKDSLKINKYIPGTNISVIDEKYLYKDQPDYALLFSWHISKDIMFNLRKRGFKGKFIIPLPNPIIV
jgi:ribosomal protein L20A (L18A)